MVILDGPELARRLLTGAPPGVDPFSDGRLKKLRRHLNTRADLEAVLANISDNARAEQIRAKLIAMGLE